MAYLIKTPSGKLMQFGSTVKKLIASSGVSPEPVIELPAQTLRFRFSQADTDPSSIDNGVHGPRSPEARQTTGTGQRMKTILNGE